MAPNAAALAHRDTAVPLHTRARRVLGAGPIPLPRHAGEAVYISAGGPVGDTRVFGVVPTDDGTWLTTLDGVVRVQKL